MTRKTAKKTQVETCDKFILAANTEDLKIEHPNKFKNQVAGISTNHQDPQKVVLAEKYQIAEKAETAQNAKSKIATHMWINFLKKICAKSKKIAAEVYSVEVEIEK